MSPSATTNHRVVAIEIGTPGRRDDPHPAALQLEGGRQVSAMRALTNLRYGVEGYYVEENGRRHQVRKVGPCPRCGLDYLRADDDATTSDRLLRLPTSPFGPTLTQGPDPDADWDRENPRAR